MEATPHEYRIKVEKPELDLIKKYPIKKVLEVFSGDGRNVAYFSKLGYSVTGIESDEQLIKKSQEIIKESITTIKHPVFMAPLPFNGEEFDFVYSYQYLNHNYKHHIEFVFREIYRVLKKGGFFSIKITDIEQFNLRHIQEDIYEEMDPEFPKIKYRKLAEQTFAKLEDNEIGIPHYGFYQDELVSSLEKCGLYLINIRKIRWNLVGNFGK
jgi:SAM-dependent methyltransferase